MRARVRLQLEFDPASADAYWGEAVCLPILPKNLRERSVYIAYLHASLDTRLTIDL